MEAMLELSAKGLGGIPFSSETSTSYLLKSGTTSGVAEKVVPILEHTPNSMKARFIIVLNKRLEVKFDYDLHS
eukprot:m.183918 g.183918  ORF g.183918 m.183918 type:complete len:73 (-) comp32171_c0_seq2:150-368(-)